MTRRAQAVTRLLRARDEDISEMSWWCVQNASNPRVLGWIERNKPPKAWEGSALEWAYVERPMGLVETFTLVYGLLQRWHQ